jgi:predicted nuclease of predicted toxin-antitoxin system
LESIRFVRIKLDENLSQLLQPMLEAEGHDTETVFGEGLSGRDDLQVGAAAKQEDRMLFTLDVEFADLRKYPPGSHPGVILFRPRTVGPLTVNRFVLEFVRETNLSELAGCVVVVDLDRVRVRRPPDSAEVEED